ncbi:MAG TPA: GTP 3',8-cyclase MoaA [Chitinophagaceae bacterium]|nr:GTP 3',8-cyclase MoaA [Chitinophagaceae bacterium]
MLTDNHGRTIHYLRLSVTDRCNLRCFYCMPEQGLDWLSRQELMSDEEMLRICRLLVQMGITKIRITGGEPFVRKDMLRFLTNLANLPGLQQLSITTNGVLTAPLVPQLKAIGIRQVNLSLDTLDRNRFFAITHRDEFDNVMKTLDQLLLHDMEVKINAVVMEGKNTQDILPLVELTKDLPVNMRFIEEMPFNGKGSHYDSLPWNYLRILETIRNAYPGLQKLPDAPAATAYNYQVPGHRGSIGVIAAYTRTFCGSCNRLRITPAGMLKTCLYDDGVLNLRDELRKGLPDEAIGEQITRAVQHRAKDGWEAQLGRKDKGIPHESMASIGG